jgi:two-component system, NtrC family, sensor histidine kinase KinB
MPRLGLRLKLLFGFGRWVLILVVIGCEGITLITQQGQSIDVMLRENYRFVIACEEMKDAIGENG